jgi:hypothetical protein
MADDFEQSINFLDPESRSQESEGDFEISEHGSDASGQPQSETQPRRPKISTASLAAMHSTTSTLPDKDPVLLEIENILSANLLEIYNQLPENKREEFKVKGEEVASKIHDMILNAKLKVSKVFKLISDWLKLVPGINVYFLQQEAKIKLDRIAIYAHERAKEIHDFV